MTTKKQIRAKIEELEEKESYVNFRQADSYRQIIFYLKWSIGEESIN